MKATCPNDTTHDRFSTAVEVLESWIVDAEGNYLETRETLEVVHGPGAHHKWHCAICGAKANVEDDLERESIRVYVQNRIAVVCTENEGEWSGYPVDVEPGEYTVQRAEIYPDGALTGFCKDITQNGVVTFDSGDWRESR